MSDRGGCVFDVLKQAVLARIRSMYDVDDTGPCTVVIRRCKSDDCDISVTLARRQDVDITVSGRHQPVQCYISCSLMIMDIMTIGCF